MAESGESPRMIKANALRNVAASGLAGMRENADRNALSSPGDHRSRIEAGLGKVNDRLTEAHRRVGGVTQEPVIRTQKGAEQLAQLASEVGYQLPPSATVAVETVPVAAERKSASSSILSIFRSLFKE